MSSQSTSLKVSMVLKVVTMEADCCTWVVCSFRSPTHTFSLTRQVCFKNIPMSISETAFTWTAFHLSMPCFPLHLPNSSLLLLSPPPTPSSHREAPIVAPHVDSPFLWTVAKSGIWSEFEWCRYEPFRDTLSWKGHYRASSPTPLFYR